jgi:hypothetical protein
VNLNWRQAVLAALLTLSLGTPSFAVRQAAGHHKHSTSSSHHGRFHRLRILWNPFFRPSHDSLIKQNEEIDRLDLPRIQDDAELEQLVSEQELVPLRVGPALRIDPRLDPDRRYCRPWTRDFLEDLSDAYYLEFREQMQVNSAVRTVKVQKKLRRHNRNAAPAEGDTASSHLAGVTVDIQRRGMTRKQVKWVEEYMAPLHDLGLIEPEEERHQWVFHVMVSARYDDWKHSNGVDYTRVPYLASSLPAADSVIPPDAAPACGASCASNTLLPQGAATVQTSDGQFQ